MPSQQLQKPQSFTSRFLRTANLLPTQKSTTSARAQQGDESLGSAVGRALQGLKMRANSPSSFCCRQRFFVGPAFRLSHQMLLFPLLLSLCPLDCLAPEFIPSFSCVKLAWLLVAETSPRSFFFIVTHFNCRLLPAPSLRCMPFGSLPQWAGLFLLVRARGFSFPVPSSTFPTFSSVISACFCSRTHPSWCMPAAFPFGHFCKWTAVSSAHCLF